MIILDTDAVSDLMRSRPSPKLVARLADVSDRRAGNDGDHRRRARLWSPQAGRPDLYERAAGLLEGVYVLDFDRRAAEKYGRVRASLEGAGRCLADPDLRIAAIALAHRATLVTGNMKHFSRVPDLAVDDWLHEHR